MIAVERASRAAATALATGETGVGKELIARAIHAFSPRRAQPLIAFNCAYASRELFESIPFDHRNPKIPIKSRNMNEKRRAALARLP